LKDGGRGAAGGRRAGRFANSLVVAELSLTVVLLCGAGLMLRSFVALYASEPGFAVEGLSRMRLQLPPSNYPTAESRQAFFDRLMPRLQAIPGIQGVAVTTATPPLDGPERVLELDGDAGPVDPDDEGRWVSTVTVTPGYFSVLGVPMIRGRDFDPAAGTGAARTVIISQVLADRFFPGRDPVGRQLRFTPDRNAADPPAEEWRTIVGVSGRFLQGATDEAFRSAVVYLPFREDTPRTSALLVRSALPPATVMADVRRAVQAVDADQPVFTIQTLAAVLAEERLIHRIFATLFAVLAAIALVLSSVGLYSVMAYAVTQRTQEIGVRMAVGAQRWAVSWLFLRKALGQLVLALALGLPAALALGQAARFQLVEIEPSDPVTMVGITLVLVAVAIAASVIPVRRASRIDPVVALRSE
jgi:putative ABC transport system permease protein